MIRPRTAPSKARVAYCAIAYIESATERRSGCKGTYPSARVMDC